jgi:predicted phage terminase large subunit-like protein
VDLVRPSYRWHRHCELLAAVLQRVADGEIKRLMVFMPPRHGKSELVSRLFSAYYLYRYPERWVAVSSYGAALAYTLSRAARANYRESGGLLDPEARAVSHWQTAGGGGLWATGVRGPATGKGWHLGILDDPIKDAQQAASEEIRRNNREWYESTWSTREMGVSPEDPDGAEILVQTRWHEDDIAGWLLAQETAAAEDPEESVQRWHIVNLPAIAEDEPQRFPATCTLEPDFRQPGEALCAAIRPLHRLKALLGKIGEYVFGALYQQRPTSKEGDFFKVGELQIVDAPPAALRKVRFWDKATTAGGGDFSVGLLIGTTGDGIWWILDVVRGQWHTDERDKIIRQTAQSDGPSVTVICEVGHGDSGIDAGRAFVKLLAGFPARAETATGTKQERADPLSAQVNGGNVRLVRAAWNRAFIDELRAFPRGAHDDQVDAAAYGFNELARGRVGQYLASGQQPAVNALAQTTDPALRRPQR